jgi:Co/Zn/Cd efflux system component
MTSATRSVRGRFKRTSAVLLDREMDHPLVREIREVVETPSVDDGNRVTDLHVWRVGKAAFAGTLTVVTHDGKLTETHLRRQLAVHPELVHVTIEIVQCA